MILNNLRLTTEQKKDIDVIIRIIKNTLMATGTNLWSNTLYVNSRAKLSMVSLYVYKIWPRHTTFVYWNVHKRI